MIRTKRSENTKQISGINITPFTDVCLVLLIIFMVAAPALVNSEKERDAGIHITLPKTDEKAALPVGPVILRISKDEKLFIGEKEVSFETMPDEISKYQPEQDGKRLMIVRADETVPYSVVAKAVAIGGKSGLSDILLATRYPDQQAPSQQAAP